MAASSLPKGTSLRKKFVPPFKKPEAQKEQEEEPVANKYKGLEEKLVEIIESEILEKGNTIKWTDIAGLGEAKSVIN